MTALCSLLAATAASGRAGVLVVTVPDLAAEDLDAVVGLSLPQGEDPRAAGWWSGRGRAGSEDPLRSLAGMLSGVPPLALGTVGGLGLSGLGLPARLPQSGGEFVALVDGSGPGGEGLLGEVVPGARPFVRMRPLLAELHRIREPFLIWLHTAADPPDGIPLERRMARILRALRDEGRLSETLVVITSVEPGPGTDGLVPLLVRRPAGSLGPAWGEDVLVPLEAVGALAGAVLGLDLPPAGVSSAPFPAPSYRELRNGGELVGVVGYHGADRVEVRWTPGQLAQCWRRSASACRWVSSGPPQADATRELQSRVLLQLEKVLARRLEDGDPKAPVPRTPPASRG